MYRLNFSLGNQATCNTQIDDKDMSDGEVLSGGKGAVIRPVGI